MYTFINSSLECIIVVDNLVLDAGKTSKFVLDLKLSMKFDGGHFEVDSVEQT